MPFDLLVTISMHFYERCQTKRDVEIPEGRFFISGLCLRGEGGGVLWFFHTYIGSGCFLGFKIFTVKILNFSILGVFQTTEYFWGYEDFVDIFFFFGGGGGVGVGHYKIGLYLEVISMHFRVFSGEYFLGCYTFKYLFGVLEILDIFGGLMVDAGPELTYKEKMRITPHPLVFVHQFKPIPVKCI